MITPISKRSCLCGNKGVEQKTSTTTMEPSDGDFKQRLTKVESVYNVGTHRPTIRRELKQVLVNRWSEVMSAYWMTISLFGLTVLFCYCMGVRPAFLSKLKEQKPATDVYFHHVVQGKRYLPFAYYSDFLSNMAVEYPSLQFNIFFLVDDSLQNPYRIPMNSIFFTGLLGYQKNRDAFEERTKQQLLSFEESHPNVNITVMHLSKFMAMTPLKYRWKTIPVSYLSFYARVFSVWQNGGIGMDLLMFNERFHRKRPLDGRISAILKNHDGGLPDTDYNVLLKTTDEELETVSSKKHFMHQVFNETLTMLNKLLSLITDPQAMDNALPSRENEATNSQLSSNTDNDSPMNMKSNTTSINLIDSKVNNSEPDQIYTETHLPETTLQQLNNTVEQVADPKVDQKPLNISQANTDTTDTESAQIVLVYDLVVMTDNSQQGIVASRMSSNVEGTAKKMNNPTHLALHANGMFIAATEKLHVFLDMLITAGFERRRPYCAIQHTFITQCSGENKNEAYCNIYGL